MKKVSFLPVLIFSFGIILSDNKKSQRKGKEVINIFD